MPEEEFDEMPAPEGQIWVCNACGKTARVRWRFEDSKGWDESCMLNATLCFESSLKYEGSRVVNADPVEEPKPRVDPFKGMDDWLEEMEEGVRRSKEAD